MDKDDSEKLYQAFSSETKVENVKKVISETDNKKLQYNQQVTISIPGIKNTAVIDANNLIKIKHACESARKTKFPWAELFLALASLFLGAFIGALVAQVSYRLDVLSIFSYTICPVLGIGFGVAYIFCRRKNIQDSKDLAEKISEYISDSIEGVEENEYQ